MKEDNPSPKLFKGDNYFSFQDDANHDPQWSYEQCIEAKLEAGGHVIGQDEIDIMSRTTVAVFEVLEKAWGSLNCSLIDMKIEFGVNPCTGKTHNLMYSQIVLALNDFIVPVLCPYYCIELERLSL